MEEHVVRISVRNLVEFIFRSGDIDNRRRTAAERDAMQEGSRVHRKIQQSQPPGYRAEVPLKIALQQEQYSLQIEGRADGILTDETGAVTIDEIKGMYMDLQYLREPIFVHKAQAMCYAYIYARQNGLGKISLRLTYCNLDTEAIRYFYEELAFPSLEQWFQELAQSYFQWLDMQFAWQEERDRSIRPLEFPFPYREGQRWLAKSVYQAVSLKRNLFIQAPTGVGKTISVVFPAIKAMGEKLGEKIFYLTAKTVTGTAARDAVKLLAGRGLALKMLWITAKEKICPQEEVECHPDACPYARGHYDRINDAVFGMLHRERFFTRETIGQYALEHSVCPFEMSLDLALWVDFMICDYNYVFDPNVHLKRFFADSGGGEYLFLIDEAHNMVDRCREMYSASLYRDTFQEMIRQVGRYSSRLNRALERCGDYLEDLARRCDTYLLLSDVESFVLRLARLWGEFEKFFEDFKDITVEQCVREFYFDLKHFLNMYERVDDHYAIYAEWEENLRFKIKIFCIHPARNIREYLDKGRCAVFFSATFLPIQYYKKLLSNRVEEYAIYVNSPFQAENRLLLVGSDVSTSYRMRGEELYRKMACYIQQVAGQRRGNYMVFFPSYKFLEEVYDAFVALGEEDTVCLLQTRNMGEAARREFLEEFSRERTETLIGFCVLGGIFGEGIDLKEEQLIGAIIMGTGIPQVCNERKILQEYYDRRAVAGFDYTYRYPGMNRVLQAAGRVIRTDRDRGVILLLDHRFAQRGYTSMFPREWEQRGRCTLETVGEQVRRFWDET